MKACLLCLGYGYTATVLAQRFKGWQPEARLIGTSRTFAAAQSDTAPGAPDRRRARTDGPPVERVLFDGCTVSGELRAAAEAASHVLISIPADAEGCPAARALGPLLAQGERRPWVGYLSATSVYGDRAGGWCFESEAPTPSSARGQARASAEAAWRGLDLPVHVFRLPGIYGPGRSVFDRIAAGTSQRIVKPGAVFNRVHVADIAAALLASTQRPQPGAIYNVADDEPAPPQDPIVYAADLMGRPPPPAVSFADAAMSPMARSFYSEPKRVANAAIKAALGWRPAHPTYREGLSAIHAAREAQDVAGKR